MGLVVDLVSDLGSYSNDSVACQYCYLVLIQQRFFHAQQQDTSMACIGKWTLLMSIALVCGCSAILGQSEKRKVHIVYMGNSLANPEKATSLYQKVLAKVLSGKEEVARSMVYSYTASFSGFAAELSTTEAASISKMPGVVSVFPSSVKKLHTTRSWDFLGLSTTSNHGLPTGGSNIIIGVLDSGVWPESESFSDKYLPDPIPSRWKGTCVSGDSFSSSNCNRKLIGARMFPNGYEQNFGPIIGPGEYRSPRDAEGHGSHTASTAGGSSVKHASLFGLAEGTARGGTPTARIAAYKVCWFGSCTDADILAAFDEAVADGVDLISSSIGGSPQDYFSDSIAIGAFHAVQNGVFVSSSAGNSGPSVYTATNVAPWLTTVAASSIDRKFTSSIVLGNSLPYKGVALNTISLSNPWYPLVSGEAIRNASSPLANFSKYCYDGTMALDKVKDSIVVCYGGVGAPDATVLAAGGAGVILVDSFDKSVGFAFSLPCSVVGTADAKHILKYINSTSFPVADILPSITTVDDSLVPQTAIFSSRGPNVITPDILKPDITAPGVDILAAWSPVSSISGESTDNRSTSFNIISGTSMSCPHVTGAAAFVKSFHPEWSPAAIKSALMTTATPLDGDKRFNKDGPLGYGSGLISPTKATDPGLVYDADTTDFSLFLCGLNYTSEQVQLISGFSNFSCPEEVPSVIDLNYPSIAIANVQGSLNKSIIRTLTNVGFSGNSTYTVHIQAPKGVSVTVSPSCLHFDAPYQRLSFHANFQANSLPSEQVYLSGALTWTDGIHFVRSPVLIWPASFTVQ
ncbi:hypothetical protein O6H91_22G070100 [Diphasiastrum complanatum]|uniref:Uncharacterized protein n=3 Tax=Diphasiastrum complanatum TaxID=34168 RepID=A0ACC2AGU7_DIPCM|nr:hypothetical protein O6H91_22G070100 [Diphasiastrum complanatum]KAJ7516768.1 hypothetical protein O6H91_22G070100 [Diphasiastrum complanatum]KAJ7516769.1 hypothetical protein O6H91_22G070100 [Diphasiastrum complanatum]